MFAKSRLIGLGCLLLAWASVVVAQVEDQPVGDAAVMEKTYKKIKQKFFDVVGSDKAPTKDELGAIELAAQYFVFRLTWPEYADNQDALAKAIKEFNLEYKNRFISNQAKDWPHPQTSVAFHKAIRDSFKKVLIERDFTKNRLTSVNVAQLLPVLGKSKSEEISDLLTGLVNDPKQNDAVKLYAMRGLKEYFPLDPGALTTSAGDVKRVLALTNYIERKWDIKGASKEELAACSYLRREAIRCLAPAQAAAVKYPKKQVEGQTASTLLRVLAKDALEPPPTLSEKCAAAFALCNIKSLPRDYHADMAIYAVAHTLGQFIVEYRNDQINFRKDPNDIKKQGPKLPWKALSEEWEVSLANLVANTNDANAKKLQNKTEGLLKSMRNYQNLDESRANDFINIDAPALKTPQKIPFKDNTPADGKRLDVELGYD